MENMITDEKLFSAFLCGDEASFEVLMERYGDRVTAYIAARIEDSQEAEEQMIEAFARVVSARPHFKEEGTFRAYLFKTARSVAIRFNREYHRHSHFALDDLMSEPEALTDHLKTIFDKERSEGLGLCMEKLQPDYREALYLHYFEEMDLAQIASVMGRSRIAVEHLLGRGRRSLRELLAEEGITDAL